MPRLVETSNETEASPAHAKLPNLTLTTWLRVDRAAGWFLRGSDVERERQKPPVHDGLHSSTSSQQPGRHSAILQAPLPILQHKPEPHPGRPLGRASDRSGGSQEHIKQRRGEAKGAGRRHNGAGRTVYNDVVRKIVGVYSGQIYQKE